MDTRSKTAALALLALAGSALLVVKGCVDDDSPTPSVSPTPLVSVSPNPTALPTPITPPVGGTLSFYAMKGETVGFELRGAGASEALDTAKAFEIKTYKTKTPSFIGARVGDWEDPLVPATKLESGKNYWVEVTVPKTQAPGQMKLVLGNKQVAINVVNATMPDKPTMPMYMELTFAKISAAHGLPDVGENLAARGALNKKYRDALRAHRIEPIKQAISFNPSDLDFWKEFGVSFRQTTIDGAIAPPCISSQNVPTSNLAKIRAAVPTGWSYTHDEGEGVDEPAIESEVAAVAKASPGIEQWITHTYSDKLANLGVTRPVPVFELFVPARESKAKKFGLYGSCMSSGTCDNGKPGKATGTPNLAMDADPINARAFPVVMYSLGASHGLYYSAIEKLGPIGGDTYLFGNNGDGTLFYVCGDGPCPSIRLKRMLQGMNDIEWMAIAKSKNVAFTPLAKSTTDWSKDSAAYEAMRAQIASKL